MGIEIDSTTYNPPETDERATAMHVRFVPMMSSTLVEIVTYDGRGMDRPRLRVRGSLPYPIMEMPMWHQSLWNAGDELMRLAHEISTWPID